jgi:hypothetical protein
VNAIPAWRLAGEYLENCNCEVLCPCIVGPRNERGGALARPTEGHCDVPMVFDIAEGRFGEVRLDGLAAALTIYTPGPMGAGNWTVGFYADERAGADQRAALEAIFGGETGGPPGRLAALVATRLPTRSVPIRFEKDGRRRRALISGVLDIEIEGLAGADGTGEVWLDNVRHLVARRLAIARATRSAYRDHGFHWNNTGRNGHYAPFTWTGP